MAKGLDSFNDLTPYVAQLKAEGFAFVCRYYFKFSKFKKVLTASEAKALQAAGIGVVSIYENGNPIESSYFTVNRAQADAQGALDCAKNAGQPKGTVIYFAVDGDVPASSVLSYFRTLTPLVKAGGYKVGVYGSGVVCKKLMELDLVEMTWLSQSSGWAGHKDWAPHADIVQGPVATWKGLDVDWDTAMGNPGTWSFLTIPDKPAVTFYDFSAWPTVSMAGTNDRKAMITLQSALNILFARRHVPIQLKVDASFGPATQTALIAAQKMGGLTADGICGPKTWKFLQDALNA